MTVLYQKNFLKDLTRVPLPLRKKVEHFVFNELPMLRNFQELRNAEKNDRVSLLL